MNPLMTEIVCFADDIVELAEAAGNKVTIVLSCENGMCMHDFLLLQRSMLLQHPHISLTPKELFFCANTKVPL